MPATSKAQQRFMGMVHAAQKGEEPASPEVAKAADSMSKADAKDFASTKHKGLPDKKEESINSLKEYIRKMVREMNTTGNVQGYQTPYAFGKKGNEKAKGKKQADLTGYTVVNEANEREIKKQLASVKAGDQIEVTLDDGKKSVFQRVGINSKREPTFKYIHNGKPAGKDSALDASYIKSVKMLSENRWLELRNEESPAKVKIDKGISGINKQLAEMEKFLNWYGRIKQENGVSNDQFWKRTNRNIYSIKERLIRLEQKIRKISE